MQYEKVYEYVIEWLSRALPRNLYYHGLHHTIDVCQAAEKIAHLEQVSSSDTILVKTAALLHDTGFTEAYFSNEPIGAANARKILPNFGYKEEDVSHIEEMILATALPQSPKSKLAEILCDADLDYLGRKDFYAIAHTLKQEWGEYGLKRSLRAWYEQQIKFVKNHQYFTESSRLLRNNQKQAYILEMEELLGLGTVVDTVNQTKL